MVDHAKLTLLQAKPSRAVFPRLFCSWTPLGFRI